MHRDAPIHWHRAQIESNKKELDRWLQECRGSELDSHAQTIIEELRRRIDQSERLVDAWSNRGAH